MSSLTGADGKNYTVTNNLLTSAVSEESGTRKEWLLVWAGDENIADTAVATVRGLPGALNVDLGRLRRDVVNALPGTDFLAVIDATKGSPTYGQVVNTATVGPLVENEPHHMQYIWHKGDKIFAGGLFTAATYVFDVAKLPELSLSGVSPPTQTLSGSVPDAYWVLEDGTAYGTYMGGPVVPGPYTFANGQTVWGNGFAGSPGSLIRFPFWSSIPQGTAVSFANTPLGYPGALGISLALIGVVVGISLLVQRRRRPPPLEEPPRAAGLARILRGSWPLWVGALALAGLNAATLWASGTPWGITSAFGLWGSEGLAALGVDVGSWAYWQVPNNAAALANPVLADKTSVMDFGIVLGALVASAAAGAFVLHRKVPLKLAAGSIIGGILMGYGARIAGGCNIGAYFSGIASFSLHGWVWGAVAIVGTVAGLALRPLFGLRNPKPSDSVC